MYLTYAEYQTMGGTLDETTFNSLEFEARARIDYITFNRLKNETTYSEAVKRCVYKLVELIYLRAQSLSVGQDSVTGSTNAAISGQSNDGFSVTFNVLSAQMAVELSKTEIDTTISTYLSDVTNSLGQKVLYRGYYENE